jgi:hypothetical protein
VRKTFLTITGIVLVAIVVTLGVLYWRNFQGLLPLLKPPPQFTPILPSPNSTTSPLPKNTTGMPLEIPENFSISIFAKDLGKPRVLALDPQECEAYLSTNRRWMLDH